MLCNKYISLGKLAFYGPKLDSPRYQKVKAEAYKVRAVFFKIGKFNDVTRSEFWYKKLRSKSLLL